MLPLKDNIPSRTYPAINVMLVIANIVVYVYQVLLGPEQKEFIYTFGLVPRYFFSPAHYLHVGLLAGLAPLMTCMFLHGGLLHLGGNMLFLWIFGDNVEDRLGHWKYLCFYLMCGILAGLLHVSTHPSSPVPTIGASGAIAGVLGAYMVMFPRSRVLTLVPIFFFLTTVEIPAFLFLGFWFVLQFLNGLQEPLAGSGGVATWAHIGGFVAGIYFAKKWVPPPRYQRRKTWFEE